MLSQDKSAVFNAKTLSPLSLYASIKNFQASKLQFYSFLRADLSHRIPSHQPDQLIEQHKNKKQCGARYKVPSFIQIHILVSVY